jgi:hypothetical protein
MEKKKRKRGELGQGKKEAGRRESGRRPIVVAG